MQREENLFQGGDCYDLFLLVVVSVEQAMLLELRPCTCIRVGAANGRW